MKFSDTLPAHVVANLEVLSAFLKRHVPPPEFAMRDFITSPREKIDGARPRYLYKNPESYNKCGTAACAVGHAPLAGIKPKKGEDWNSYGLRVFGCNYSNNEGAFMWMFGGTWSGIDNTPEGAAARIDWYLKNGVPESSSDQMYGATSLCYKVKK